MDGLDQAVEVGRVGEIRSVDAEANHYLILEVVFDVVNYHVIGADVEDLREPLAQIPIKPNESRSISFNTNVTPKFLNLRLTF